MASSQSAVKLRELAALTRLYLLQEYSVDDRLPTDPDNFQFFKRQALEQKKAHSAAATIPAKEIREPQNGVQGVQMVKSEPLPPPKVVEKEVERPQKTVVESAQTAKAEIKPLEPEAALEQASAATPTRIAKGIALELPKAPTATDFSSLKTCILKLFPHYPLVDTIPSDEGAKQLKNPKKSRVAIIARHEIAQEHELLTRLCQAIQRSSPCMLLSGEEVEAANAWNHFLDSAKLILITSAHLQQLPLLQIHYRATSDGCYLGDVPVILLDELRLYIKEPQRKKALWENLMRHT